VAPPTPQELHRLLHRLSISLLGNLSRAGSQTAAHLAFQTGSGPGSEIAVLAGPDAKDLLHHLEGLPNRAAGGVRAEVQSPVRRETPHQAQGRKRVFKVEAEAEKIFVVPQPDVKTGRVLLDQVAFQDQRFPGLGSENIIHPGRPFQHQRGLGVVLARFFEVRGQAVFEIHRFAHVEHPAAGILEQINPRGPGRLGQSRA